MALLPNLPLSIYSTGNPSGFAFGGANEDYDAADFQNMILAAQVPVYDVAPYDHRVLRVDTLPSFHRPALVRYWFNKLANDASFAWPGAMTDTQKMQALLNPAGPEGQLLNASQRNTILSLERKIMFRPLQYDNPDFTGSNPNFNPAWTMLDTTAQWDVDNDGDGRPDSIWVDLGYPAQQTADGRWYRPLFAILCVDLDGRLNLNAHGSLPQADAANHYNMSYFDATTGQSDQFPSSPFAGTGVPIARGQGIGPADINLRYA